MHYFAVQIRYNGNGGYVLDVWNGCHACWPWTNSKYVYIVLCCVLSFEHIVVSVRCCSCAILLSKYTTMAMMILRSSSLVECMQNVMLALDEQQVRLHRCVIEYEGIIIIGV